MFIEVLGLQVCFNKIQLDWKREKFLNSLGVFFINRKPIYIIIYDFDHTHNIIIHLTTTSK